MKRIRIVGLLVLTLFIGVTLSACSNQLGEAVEDNGGEHHTITVTDDLGKEVAINKVPERIVSLTPSNTEILFALGLEDKVVGVTSWCNYPDGAKNKEIIGDLNPNVEKILSLQPDLVLATLGDMNPLEAIKKAGIPVFVVNPGSFDEVLASFRKIGQLTGKAKEADELIAQMTAKKEKITDKLEKISDKPKVFIVLEKEPELFTAGQGTFIDELITLAGGKNIAATVDGYPKYSMEQLLIENPDVIIVPQYEGNMGVRPGDLSNDPVWQEIAAVRQHKIYEINADIISRPGPRLINALEQIAEILHPQAFEGE